MAITNIVEIDGVTAAVSSSTPFVVTSSALVTADGFGRDEYAMVWRLGPDGGYTVATNKDGSIYLSDIPNTVVLDGPGTYMITKTATASAAYVGYEE